MRPSPPTDNCGALARLVSPGGGTLANLGRPGGRAFAYLGLDKLVKVFSTLCISSLLIKAQLELSSYIARQGTISVNRRMHASLVKDLLLKHV